MKKKYSQNIHNEILVLSLASRLYLLYSTEANWQTML